MEITGSRNYSFAISTLGFGGVAVRWGRIVIVFFGVLWACHIEPACRYAYV